MPSSIDTVAYCSPETGHQLLTVDDVPELASIRYNIPDGKYQPARYSKTRARADGEQEDPQTGGALIDFPVRCAQPYQATPPPVIAPVRPAAPMPPRDPAPLKLPSPNVDLKLPKVQPLPRRDPDWVRNNYVLISPDIRQMQSRKLFNPEVSKEMAPLVYMRRSPYRARHPLDNDALRALDSVS